MTPKVKARELVEKFVPLVDVFRRGVLGGAKECALIAVEEVLKIFKSEYGKPDEFWEEVKTEIEKL